MYIKQHFHLIPTVDKGTHKEVEGVTRKGYTTDQYISMSPTIKTVPRTAVLFVGSASTHPSESRRLTDRSMRFCGGLEVVDTTLVIRELLAFSLHRWVGTMIDNSNVVFASINSNTCASSMYCLYEAYDLLSTRGIDEVIIIAEERVNFSTVRVFKESNVPVVVSDGLAILHLSSDSCGAVASIDDVKWYYEYNKNPFATTASGYGAIDSKADYVKLHGTGTDTNNCSESVLTNGKVPISYKQGIGHTLGSSTAIELCMAINDGNIPTGKDVLISASGLGNFYGSCVMRKL